MKEKAPPLMSHLRWGGWGVGMSERKPQPCSLPAGLREQGAVVLQVGASPREDKGPCSTPSPGDTMRLCQLHTR